VHELSRDVLVGRAGDLGGQGDVGMTPSLQEAQELYGDALAGGQSSFLLQQEEARGDVFSCSLGNLPPGEEAMLTLSYTYELLLEHDGAARYVLPTVLHPRYTPHRVGWGEHHPGGPAGPPRGAALHPEPKCHAAVAPRHPLLSSCPLTPLSYTARDLTTAQVSLAQAPRGTGTWSCWCITRSHTNPARCWRPGCPEPS
ncbi:unnamed protein product, partial [Eretmochelys imbricata]